MSNVKGKGQRLIPEELLKYLEAYKEAHPDPTAGGGATLDDIVDSQGNKRFIEGNGTPATTEGFTSTYCKWSLSGTHLMLVIAGSFANGTAMPAVDWAKFKLPTWILNKIYTVWNDRIERKNIELIASNYSAQNLTVYLGKGVNYLFITAPAITLTAERFFRIQFDLLIDSE